MVLKPSDGVTRFFFHRKYLGTKLLFPAHCWVKIQVGHGTSWPWGSYFNSNSSMGYAQIPSIDLGCQHWLYLKQQIHVRSLRHTRSPHSGSLHENEMLGCYHPVLSLWAPKISSFNPHMTFYSTTLLRLWCIWKPEIFTLKITQRDTGGNRWMWATVRNRALRGPTTYPWRPLIRINESMN